jgi:hypothetical protein
MACLSASGHYIPRFVVIRGLGYKDNAVLKFICHLGQKQYFGRVNRWNGDRLLNFFIFNCSEALWSSMGTDRISRTCQHKRRHYETMSYCYSCYHTAPTDSSHWMCHVSVYWKRSTMMLQKICLKILENAQIMWYMEAFCKNLQSCSIIVKWLHSLERVFSISWTFYCSEAFRSSMVKERNAPIFYQ